MEVDCPFCLFFEDGVTPNWDRLFGESELVETAACFPGLALILDTSPLVEGHAILIPDGHYLSFAAVPESERRGLDAVIESAVGLISRVFGESTLMEHGGASFSHNAGACVDHAHLHIVPGRHDISAAMIADFSDMREFNNWSSLADEFGGIPYVAHQLAGGPVRAAVAPMCASQYLRRLVALSAQAPERWNWRECMRWTDALGNTTAVASASRRLQAQGSQNKRGCI